MQLVVEEDARFNPFDREAWAALNAAMEPAARELETGAQGGADLALPAAAGRLETVDGVVVCRLAGSAFDRVPDKIRATVNAALPNAVAYRKRDFEADAMMRALCVRNGVALPPAAAAPRLRRRQRQRRRGPRRRRCGCWLSATRRRRGRCAPTSRPRSRRRAASS